MTISVYPRYVGPTVEYRFASLYPKWLGHIIDGIPVTPEIEAWLGGVIVLDEYYGVSAVGSGLAAMVSAIETGVLPRTKQAASTLFRGTVGVTPLNSDHEVTSFGGALTTVYATLKAGVINLTAKMGVIQRGQGGVEESDEDPMI